MMDGFFAMAHELAFNRPSYLAASLHVIDESIVGGFAITEACRPGLCSSLPASGRNRRRARRWRARGRPGRCRHPARSWPSCGRARSTTTV